MSFERSGASRVGVAALLGIAVLGGTVAWQQKDGWQRGRIAAAQDSREIAIDALADAARRGEQVADLRALMDELEKEVRAVSGGPHARPDVAQSARMLEARAIARRKFEKMAAGRAFRELTGTELFDKPRKVWLLADQSIALAERRKLYDGLVYLSHVDDYLENWCGVGAAFAAQAYLDPWVRVLEPDGADEPALGALTRDGLALLPGPVELSRQYGALELYALTEGVEPLRWLRLDFEAEDHAVPLVMRAVHPARDPKLPRVLGLRVHPSLLLPGRYTLRVRAFRLGAGEDAGCRLTSLRACMR